MIKRNYFYTFIIIFLTFFSFSPCLNNNFVNWDDDHYVINNPYIKNVSFENVYKIFSSFFVSTYLPVTILSYSFEYVIAGLNPAIYHLNNIILHLLNSVLVFYMFFLLTGKIKTSFLSGVFFGIHPLHVESVAWVSERKDVLYSFFFLLSSIIYIKYLKTKIRKYYFYSLVLFILSSLSKAMAVTLPFVLILFDYGISGKIEKKNIKDKIPFILVSIISGIVAVIGQKTSEIFLREIKPDLIFNVKNACYGIVFYLWKLFYPVKLSCIYPSADTFEGFKKLIFDISPFFAILFVTFIVLVFKKNKILFFGFSYFLITVLPVLQIIPIGRGIHADRYMYLSSAGIFYILSEFSIKFLEKIKETKKIYYFVFNSVLSLIILTLCIITHQRCYVWKDTITLFEDVTKNYKNIPVVYYNLGIEYSKTNENEKAIKYFTEAIKLKPLYIAAYNNRGNTYCKIKDYENAIKDFSKILEIDPNYTNAYVNRGNVYYYIGMYEKSIFDLTKAIELAPENPKIYYNRALVYNSSGKIPEAKKDMEMFKELSSKQYNY